MTEKYAGQRLNERRTTRVVKRAVKAKKPDDARAVALRMLKLHSDYAAQAEDLDAHNVAFEEAALTLAKMVLGLKP